MLKKRFNITGKLRPGHLLSVLFLVFIVYVGLVAFPEFVTNTGKTLQRKQSVRNYIKQTDEQYEGMLVTDSEDTFLQNKGTYINLNGLMANVLQQPMTNHRVKLKNGHLANLESGTPDPEEIQLAAKNVIDFYNDHTAAGGKFLFVLVSRQVSKYEDLLPVGYTDTGHDTADAFLSLLQKAGVPYLDLREQMHKEGISVTDAYFTTDHHWKPQTAFWAYGKILGKLASMGAIDPVDPLYTDPQNYTFEIHENTFLGSSGKRTGIYYAGLDDAVLIRPNFETDISVSIPSLEIQRQGSYEEAAYNTDAYHDYEHPDFFQENVYGLYGWGDVSLTHWRNAHAPDQSKFLLIGESYGNIPFSLMSLCLGSCDEIDLRYYQDDFSAYYDSYKPDTVVMELSVGSILSEFTTYTYLR